MRIQGLEVTFANEIRILKDALGNERRERQEEVTSMRSNYEEELSTLRDEIRSTYVRWGRTLCPENATLVYDGEHYIY